MQLIKLKKSNPGKRKEKPIRTQKNPTIGWFNEPNQLTEAPKEHQHWCNKNAGNTESKKYGTISCFQVAGDKATNALWQLQQSFCLLCRGNQEEKFWLTWQLPRACYDDERNLWLMKSCLPVFQKGSFYYSIKIKQVVSGMIPPIVILRLVPNSRNFYRKHETQFSVQLTVFTLVPSSFYEVNKRCEQFIGSQRDFFFFLLFFFLFVVALSTYFLLFCFQSQAEIF